MSDLKSKWAIYLKAGLFMVIGLASAALLLGQTPTLETAILMSLTIWSFCRAYYFAFYVIEHYVDPTFQFSGLLDFARFLLHRK